jgi:hypothetical protein
MSKRLPRRTNSSVRIFWTIIGIAALLAVAAGTIALSLRHQHPVSGTKIYFVFGAGLLAAVLLLVAQVWRARMIGVKAKSK